MVTFGIYFESDYIRSMWKAAASADYTERSTRISLGAVTAEPPLSGHSQLVTLKL